MKNDLLETFGQIVKTSRDSGVVVLTDFQEKAPKNPSKEQEPLLKLLSSLNSEDCELLKKSIKYCIDLSLFKLINTLEYGVSDYSFELRMKKSDKSITLIDNEEVDHDLTGEFWNWVE